MDAQVPNASSTADREILIERVFDAPRELVWQAWTNPKHIVQWWGPNGFTTTIKQMDFRKGGMWKMVMHGPDGTDYPNSSVFREIVEPERIVYAHGGGRKGGPAASFLATWTFEELGKKTRLTIRMQFDSPEQRDLVAREYGAIEGGRQTLARLADFLAHTDTRMPGRNTSSEAGAIDLVITRIFDAPQWLVWQAWTDPEHVKQWWGPQGFHNESCASDLRVGGNFRLEMRAPDGNVYPCVGTFREIVKHERIVYEGEAMEGHPCGAGIPPRATMTVSFAEQDGKTHLTLHTRFASAERKEAAAEARFVISWEEALERLAGTLRV